MEEVTGPLEDDVSISKGWEAGPAEAEAFVFLVGVVDAEPGLVANEEEAGGGGDGVCGIARSTVPLPASR